MEETINKMPVETHTISVSTKHDLDILDITHLVEERLENGKINSGIVTVFVPGSTGSVSTMEYEPNLLKDFERTIEKIAPSDAGYEHNKTWGDRNGHSHVRATIMGPSLTVPFRDRRLMLGTWQQIVLLDFDVPARRREIILQVVGD